MNIINTTAPISIDNLKNYFTDKSITFIIDYKESQLKDAKLLTYLSNLEIPCDLDLSKLDIDEKYHLVKSYMETTMVVNLKSLEFFMIGLLMEAKGMTENSPNREFIEANKDLIDSWISKLDSLTLYNMFIVDSTEFKEFVQQFPEDTNTSLVGINFISLLKNPEFYSIYSKIDESKLKFYSNYFKDYMFKGKNMYSYWANDNNPLFLLTYGIASGTVTSEEYITAKKQDIQELENVSSI